MRKIDRSQKIYRIFKKRYFFNMFEKEENTLVLPDIWEDPFENLILKSTIENLKDENGKVIVERGDFEFKNSIYMQCWGAHEVPDAMWHIYSNKRNAVQVETTVGKLIDALCNAHPGETGDCHIYGVCYEDEAKLRRDAGNIKMIHHDAEELIKLSSLIKRKAFEHEREVRLIYTGSKNKDPANNIHTYKIKPHNLIDRVIVDPRICPCEYTQFKKEIKERTNFDNVEQSALCHEIKNTIRIQ